MSKIFLHLKQVSLSLPILDFFWEYTSFISDIVSSDHVIGAVLSKVQDGEEKVIAYYSGVL